MDVKTAAGIVTCNPDTKRLEKNIDAVIGQVDYVILVDNGSSNRALIEALAAGYGKKLKVCYSPANRGIAWALNRIFDKAIQLNLEWVITLDDDSVCPHDMINGYLKYLGDHTGEKIGILCPTIVDRNAGVIEGGFDDAGAVKRCITSGAFTSCRGWSAIGGFDEKMFIDGVDFDFCDRLWCAGYSVIRIGDIRLIHELGHMTSHRFLFGIVKVQNHSAKRKYYIVRNRFYLARKRHRPFSVSASFCFALKFSVTILLYESDKRAKLGAVLCGIRDGLRM